jgi:predicted oxidoreductase
LHPGIKKRVTRAVAGAAQDESRAHRCDYSVEEMRRSLRTSLGQLKTGQVDLFFLHEPSVRDAIPAGLGEALEAERQSGRIGAFGVSAWARDLPGLLQSRPELAGQARQYDHSVFDAEPALSSGAGGSFTGFFSVIRRAHGPMLECLDTDRNFAREWSGRLNLDLLQPEQAGIVILSLALLLNPQGLVLFSSTRPERLRAVVGGLRASSLEPEQLLEFRKAVSARMVNSHAR